MGVHQVEVDEHLFSTYGLVATVDGALALELQLGATLLFNSELDGSERLVDVILVGLPIVAQGYVQGEGTGTLDLHVAISARVHAFAGVHVGLDETAGEVAGLGYVGYVGERYVAGHNLLVLLKSSLLVSFTAVSVILVSMYPIVISKAARIATMARIAVMQKNATYTSRRNGVRIATSIRVIILAPIGSLLNLCICSLFVFFISFTTCACVLCCR